MMDSLREWIPNPLLFQLAAVSALLLACGLLNLGLRRGVIPAIEKLVSRSRARWDDALRDGKVFTRLAAIPPALLLHTGVHAIPELDAMVFTVAQRVAMAWMVLAGALALGGFLTAANAIYSARPENRERSIKGYIQVVKILLYLATGIVIVTTFMDRSPVVFLSGLGAMTAILLLVFKDTILSLVASIQVTSYDMVRVGDWLEMPSHGADGDVVDISLHTVKIQNWDKTITTVPTHKLISDSFKNWRGMSESGGRRIKRALHLDVSSVRFLEDDEIERFGRFALLKDYIAEKRRELEEHNRQQGLDGTINADIRRLTNIGTLRRYVVNYLRNHPKIHKEMTLIVRQRDPGPTGLPIEIYTFASDTAWSVYEDIQSDIFDHVLAIIPEFGLRVFQSPTGHDLTALKAS